MRRGTQFLLVGSVVAVLGIAGTLTAFADWAVPGTVTTKARAATMPRGVQPSVVKQLKTAVISWSAQQIGPDAWMDEYVVTAHSLNTPPLPDVTHTVTATDGPSESVTFSAGEVAGGTWQWTITPHFRHWVGPESRKSSRLTFAVTAAATKAEAPAAVAIRVEPPAEPVEEPPTPAAPKPETEPTSTHEPTPEPTEAATSTPPAPETTPTSDAPPSGEPAESDLTD
jgi:hypothetical protein